MPLFISDEELTRHSTDASYVASKADDFIRTLQNELETVTAASIITAELTFSLLEQKLSSLSTEFNNLQSQMAQIGEMERLRMEVSELHKSKRQLLDLVEQKDLEISDKSAKLPDAERMLNRFRSSLMARRKRMSHHQNWLPYKRW